MRDRESDIKSGKRTLVVIIGPIYAKYYHYFLLISSFLLALFYMTLHYKSPFQFLFVIVYIPIAVHFRVVYKNNNSKLLDPELKKLAISTFLFSIFFGLGILLFH